MTALGPKCRDLESMKNRIAQLMTVETSNHSSMGCVPCVFDFNLSLLLGARACKPLTCLQLHDHIVCQCTAARVQLASGIW